jgi:hypothetical protein
LLFYESEWYRAGSSGSEEVEEVELIHEDEEYLYADDEDGEHALLLLAQVAA